MEEGRDRVLGFIGQALGVFQVGWRLREQRRQGEEGRLMFHLGCSVGGAENLRKLMLILVLVVAKNDNHHLSLHRVSSLRLPHPLKSQQDLQPGLVPQSVPC